MRGRKLQIGETSVRLYARHTKTCSEKADNSGVFAGFSLETAREYPPDSGLGQRLRTKYGKFLPPARAS